MDGWGPGLWRDDGGWTLVVSCTRTVTSACLNRKIKNRQDEIHFFFVPLVAHDFHLSYCRRRQLPECRSSAFYVIERANVIAGTWAGSVNRDSAFGVVRGARLADAADTGSRQWRRAVRLRFSLRQFSFSSGRKNTSFRRTIVLERWKSA